MKKIYTLALAMLIGGAAWAQSSLTFQVDMSGQTVSANGVHIAGDFQAAAGAPSNWDPAATALTQVGTSSIYAVTVNIPDGFYQFKFINGNAWGDDESVPAVSQVSAGINLGGGADRWVYLDGNDTLPAIMYGGAAPAGYSAVSMALDMSLEAAIDTTISVAGNFQGWTPGATELYDILADSMYRHIAYIPTNDTMDFKYLNGGSWGTDENVPSACAVNNNRQLIISGDTVFGPTCFAQCGPCFVPDTFNVTVQVDLSNSTCSNFDPAVDSVDIAGPFNGWGGGDFLSDPDGDMIYEGTFYVPSPEFTYKARMIQAGNANWEPGGNNVITFSKDTIVPPRCFGIASIGACGPQPDPSDITFQVDMSNGPASFVKVFLMSNFTDPQWQGGAIELTASATQPGVFETTVAQICPGRFAFKYMIEDGTGTQLEESFLTANDTTCLEPSGNGDFNRFYQRPDDQPQTLLAPWEDCSASIGLNEDLSASLNIYPNPSNGITNIELPKGSHEVRIYNLTGSVVASFSNVENSVQWNAGNLTTGVYLVSVSNNLGFTATQKVVLK